MCELLGVSSKERRRLNDILREFYSHADAHPHGWGLATLRPGEAPAIEKEAVAATASATLGSILCEPIEESALLAHIRLATIGAMEYANCHPFMAADNSGRVWTLVHNGTMFNGAELNGYIGIQFGETDSERVLLHLVAMIDREQIRKGHALGEKERFGVLSDAVAGLSKGNKLNLLVFDGEFMYAHANFRDSLHSAEGGCVMFSTRPLSHGEWKPVPFTRLVAVKDGEFVREGPSHGNEYIYNPDDYRLVYMNFARL